MTYLVFTITLDKASLTPITYDYATANGTATAGSDYVALSGQITFAPGETSKTISVPVIGDAHPENGETLTLNLSNPVGGGTINDGTGLGTITNDDGPQYFALSGGSFTQDWTNTGLITANDNWSGVPFIIGYLGQDITTATGVNPQTLLTDSLVANDIDVIANQTNPNTLTSGGVAEFQIANPTIALQGSGTADAPHIILYLDSTGRSNVNVSYNLRDIDGSVDDAVQQVALQYRIGNSGAWINVPAGYVADATTGGSATQVTAISVTLPPEANNQAALQVRIITTNAVGNDEWVGVDDIVVSSAVCGPQPVDRKYRRPRGQ